MLSKLDLELYKILDSEVLKDLSFGCFYTIDNKVYRILSDEIPQYIQDKGRSWSNGPYNYMKVGAWHIYNKDDKGFFRWKGEDGGEKTREYFDFEILGHYLTTNEVLRYCIKRKCSIYEHTQTNKVLYIIQRKIGNEIELNIKTPIQKQTDEEKQKLIIFLNLIK